MVAVSILMKQGAESSDNLRDIKGIGICGGTVCNIYAVDDLYIFSKDNPDVKVRLSNSSAFLVPTMALNGDLYIRSSCTDSITDPLMRLPRS